MIAFVRGILTEKSPQHAVVEAGGVGYNISITLGCYETLPDPGAEVSIPTATIVREDAFMLYGFADRDEKEMFLKLISVTRVGPKLACGVLSGIKTDALRTAIYTGDKASMSKIPGVGGKTAERIIMELKDKVGPSSTPGGFPTPAEGKSSDAVAALVNLGYQKGQAEKAVGTALRENPTADIGVIIRRALSIAAG